MQRLLWTAAAAMTGVLVNAYLAGFQNAKMSTYMAQLRSSANDPMICQGVLIDPHYALFSRGCAQNHDEADKVVVGSSRTNGGLGDGELISVLKKFYSVDRTRDFAMVQLARPSNFTPVKILWDDVAPGKVVWLRGWHPFNSNLSLNRLVETTVQVIPNNKCQFKLNRYVRDSQVCGENDGIDSCSSFISGSLITELRGRDYLIGTLFVGNCEYEPVYQIFSRLSADRTFIESFLSKGT
ncbi:hypothetical protein B5M09_010151 [Aphanomyces astaci]|uniref:Peptidase S1 domain-containing protein n=2 Tax=Aphanomyces astaci TaxID=112090 RepID=A0A425DL09_APHAT|nr:hypothetical protein B5M09_010151 [Aphanomyces astaci]